MEKFNLQDFAGGRIAALPLLAAAAERRLHGSCRADFGGNRIAGFACCCSNRPEAGYTAKTSYEKSSLK